MTVEKLLRDLGAACAAYHDANVRNLSAQRIQCDEIWSFCYAKAKERPGRRSAGSTAGDVWTWTAIDADSKLIVSWLVGDARRCRPRSTSCTTWPRRLANRVQLTTDAHRLYLTAVDDAFGVDVDYAQLVQDLRRRRRTRPLQPGQIASARRPATVTGDPDPRAHQHVLRRAPEPHDADAACAGSRG